MTDNTRGILLMTLAMAGFALEDSFVKLAAGGLNLGVVVMVFGLGGGLIFAGLCRATGQAVLPRAAFSRLMALRAAFEVTGRAGYFLAITVSALSAASIILQATPLVVSLGAAVFLGERVGPRRWLAMGLGFVGVLVVLRPGLGGFGWGSLFAVIGMLGFAGRDLATRAAPPTLGNLQLAFAGFVVLIPTGAFLALWGPAPQLPSLGTSLWLGAAILSGALAYYALTGAMRLGEVSIVAPFRYTRLLFALVLAILLFDERPDAVALLGAALIVVSGVYLLTHDRRRR